MKILIVLSIHYPHCGGMSSHINTLSRGLANNGDCFHVLSASSLPLPFKVLLFGVMRVFDSIKKGLGLFLRNILIEQILSFAIFFICLTDRIDIIHAHDCIALNSAKLSRVLLRIPLVLTVHGYLTNEPLAHGDLDKNAYTLRRLFIKEEYKAYKDSDQIIAVDSRIKKYILNFIPKSLKITSMCNFVDPEDFRVNLNKNDCRKMFSLPLEKIIVLIPRRLVEKCGVFLPLYALEKMSITLRNQLFLVYSGSGPKKKSIKDFIHTKNLANVVLLGSVPHEKMKYLYEASDVVLIPSIPVMGVEEATSISALEAIAVGLPVIATNIGGLPEIIQNGVNGFLIEPNPQELADALNNLKKSEQLLLNYDGKKYAKENLMTSIEKIYSIYKQALKVKK